jgi:uncharacterized ferritin-like protein (DUF455 family)
MATELNETVYLQGTAARGRWMRTDTAELLKRYFFCERALLRGKAAWLPLLSPIDIKTELPRFVWQSAQTADALRERIFELRYPQRSVVLGDDAALVDLVAQLRDSPSAPAFLLAAGTVVVPALGDAYRQYLAVSDPIADGPTHRFLTLALAEKEEQAATISEWAERLLAADPSSATVARTWTERFAERLSACGGIGFDVPVAVSTERLPGARPYAIPDRPARDSRYFNCRFYWPDTIDPSFPYGEGVALQLRSAVSHLNEVWAVETAGAILDAFADLLPWDWVRDAARWTYDEARHCRMGYERLRSWGVKPGKIPLGTYIYDSAAGQDPLSRLGMLFFFETKNIGQKTKRAQLFHEYGDAVSEHDMDFDWADETIHAGYGKRWLQAILTARGMNPTDYQDVRDRCADLVAQTVATATAREREEIRGVAEVLIARAIDLGSPGRER